MKTLLLTLTILLTILTAQTLIGNTCFATDYTQDANCQGAWLFTEGSGATVADNTGNNKTGFFKVGGEPAWDVDVPELYASYSVAFDGIDDYIDIAIDPDTQLTPQGTIVLWCKPLRNNNSERIIGMGGVFDLIFWTSKFNWWGGSGNFDIIGSTTAAIETWFHIAITWDDNAGAELFVNASSEGNDSSINISTTTKIKLGKATGGSRAAKIKLTEVAAFNRILSQAEINEIINSGLKGAIDPLPAGTLVSPNYTLKNARIVVSGGEAASPIYSLKYVVVGKTTSGKAESANYTLDARNIDKTIPQTPPNSPTLNPVTTPTNASTQTLSGTKDANTSIYINGYQVVPLTSQTTWSYDYTLSEGDNYLIITARNSQGLESTSVTTNIFLDTSAPTAPVVTDDGISTTSTTQLHAGWSSSDPQTGIVEYQYAIGTTAGGTEVANWTSTSTQTEVTHTGLSLTQGQTYYISVKARNTVGSWSEIGSSDGIKVNQNIPQILTVQPPDASSGYTQDNINFSVNAQDADGDSLLYQFSLDSQIIQPWQSGSSFNWSTSGVDSGIHTITVEVSDNNGGVASQDVGLCLFRNPPALPAL